MKAIEEIKYHQLGKNPLLGQRHIHNDSAEILQVLSGNGTFVINGRLYAIGAGAIFFVRCMDIHSSSPCDGEYRRNILNITNDFIKNLSALDGLNSVLDTLFTAGCIILDSASAEAIDNYYRLIHSTDNTPASTAKTNADIINILCLAAENAQKPGRLLNTRTATVIDYINANITRKLTLEDIAANNFISRFYLCKIFKDNTGMSIVTYITEKRLSLAKSLIISGDSSISDIAMETGFSSFAYFSGIFKKKEGMTPSEFRKRYS